ncbi:MAG TPA: ATP-binding cassette domain-containing protein, partial [Candidatus Limnocylindrales bacterium]|nr:ATP-binding cassette domain-containing protein [Candidatus Limnocylindrales bacterium]
AVKDLTFEVRAGEVFAMLGPNGAGKSTTLRMILDILRPDTGSIAVLGGPINMARRDRIGYLPEDRGLYRNAKVIDMMVYLGTLKGMEREAARKRAMELLEELDLAQNAKQKVSELSKGMQQKVQFAVTVQHNPDLVIIDEPFSGLDPVNTMVIKDLLMGFSQRGGAVVMSTHQMSHVEEMADRLLMINRGEMALYGAVKDVRQQFALDAVLVDGAGDWATLAGVERVEPSDESHTGELLYLRHGISSDELLGELAARPDLKVRKFELAVPSLNEIFIRVVEEGNGQAAEPVTSGAVKELHHA